ncbi:hypothetical protein AB0395_40175 [Streptosporangium sp. NPDC051023]|uniref:hypothetical protein n=1 Tax=Streptosporangium sp. NPDC051023 TaxID=3155410 RepID=UPI00344C3806
MSGKVILTTDSETIVIPLDDECHNFDDIVVTRVSNETPAGVTLWSGQGCRDQWYPLSVVLPGQSHSFNPGLNVGSLGFTPTAELSANLRIE